MNNQTKISLAFSIFSFLFAFMLFSALRNHEPYIFSALWDSIRCTLTDCSSELIIQMSPADFNMSYGEFTILIRYIILVVALIGISLSQLQSKAIRKSMSNTFSTMIAFGTLSILAASVYWIQK